MIGILVTLGAGRDNSPGSPQAQGPSYANSAPAPSAPTDGPPSPAASTGSSSPSSESDPALKAPAGYTLNDFTWGITAKDCDNNKYMAQLIDLDGRPSRTMTIKPGQRLASAGPWELLHWLPGGCMEGFSAQALPNVQAGLLRSDEPKSFEACRNAAGAGFGPLNLGSPSLRIDRGFEPGAAVCSVTDKGSVSMAVIERIDQATSVTASPSVTGSLHVWSKTP